MKNKMENSLFSDFEKRQQSLKTVNISSVPQRSPFRYPGGKTWFVPTFRKWMATKKQRPKTIIEPFVGGGIISLTALFENLAEKAIMVELDKDIAAFWECIIENNGDWLADKILNFNLTKETAVNELAENYKSNKKRAFQTILKNRTYHGGILANGSGFLKYGENGKGILSRWYPETISKRIKNLNEIKNKIEFRKSDGLDVLEEYASNKDVVYFIDPPYTAGGKKAGKRLYTHYELDHEKLFKICESLKGDFIMTYDTADEVKIMAKKYNFQYKTIPMNNTHHNKIFELVIGKNLNWLD